MGGGMKKLLLSTVSVLALASAASAADVPVKAVRAPVEIPTWAGFYLGIQGGIAGSRGSFTSLGPQDAVGIVAGNEYTANRTGGIFGINAGYNFQSGNFVYGIEGDWSWLGAKATDNLAFPFGFSTTNSFDVRWLATVRGRFGITTGPALFYLTGGVAFADVNNQSLSLFPNGNINANIVDSRTKTGWTVGGGIEYMFAPHWTARVEGRYVDLGKSTATFNLNFGTYQGEFRNSLLIGLLGLAYKF